MLCSLCSRNLIGRLSLDCTKNESWFRVASFCTTSVQRAETKGTSAQKSATKQPNDSTSQSSGLRFAATKTSGSSNLPSQPVGEKVKQAGKDIFYTGIVLFGIGITGVMGYAIFHELMSSKSPSGVYADAFKLCKKDVRVKSVLGEPIKAYGDLGSMRGRRRHVQSAEFLDGDAHIVQLKFYLSGPHNSATVYVEKNVTAKEYRNLIFETDDRRERFSLLTPASSASSSIFSSFS